MISTNNGKEEELIENIEENKHYWLYSEETFNLIKTKIIIYQKEIIYLESEINLIQNKIIIKEKKEEKKLSYSDRKSLISFEISQLDPNIDDLAMIPNATYGSILNNIKFKYMQKISILKAGKITFGINLSTSNSLYNYEKFSNKIFSFKFEKNTNHTIIINGVPNSGKSTLNKNLIFNIFKNNSKFGIKQNSNKENTTNLIFMTEKINIFLEFINFFGNSIENNFRFESSRYMRVTKFYYDTSSNDNLNNFVCKIKLKHYLLEKSRILKENNFMFHIFHAFVHGMVDLLSNEEEYLKRLLLAFPEYTKTLIENFKEYQNFFIETSNIYQEFYFNDQIIYFFKEKFFLFLKICSDILFHRKILVKILNIILIILLLKKLKYSQDIDGNAILDPENSYFKMLVNLMNFEVEDENILFMKRLISREISSPSGSFYLIKFTFDEANRTKENLIKFFYENLFDFITRISNIMLNKELIKYNENKIFLNSNNTENFENIPDIIENNNIKLDSNFEKNIEKKNYFIQTIECFGFENSSNPVNNSLDNLFINYANDKINNLFFDHLIKKELNLYQTEGVFNPELIKNFGEKYSYDKDLNINNLNNLQKRDSVNLTNSLPTDKKRTSIYTKKSVNNVNLFNFDVNNTINLCDNESRGLFKLLDEQTLLINNNKGLLNSFIDKIKNNWADVFSTVNTFYLIHFGGVVEYGAPDFIFKNMENLTNELKYFCKNVFNNLFQLTIKNFKLNKEKTLKNLLKKFNEENIQDFKTENNKKSGVSGKGRLSATKNISRNTLKSKTNTEKFVKNFKKLLINIKNTNLNIIKLLNTSIEKIEDENFITFEKGLDYIIEPLNKNNYKIFENVNFRNFLKILNSNLKLKKENYENLENLISPHEFDFDDKYVLKQIYSSGIFESILLAKTGLFIRSDYKSLGEKLKNFKSFFEIKYDGDFIDWKPDNNFIKQIANIMEIEETDFIFGKTFLFINNKALLKSSSLISCVEFPKLIIRIILKKIFIKIKNLKKIEKLFICLLKNKIVKKLIKKIEIGILNLKKKLFFKKIKDIITKYHISAKKIQRKYKRFIFVKIKIISLQKFIRIFIKKIKNYKKNTSILLFENLFKKKIKTILKNIVKNINIQSQNRNKKGVIINSTIKKYLKTKNLKILSEKIFFLMNKIFENKKKFKFFNKLIQNYKEVNKLTQIQNLLRKRKSIARLKILKKSNNINFGLQKFSYLIKFKILEFQKYIFNKIKYYANEKNNSVILIQKNFKKFGKQKEIKILLNKKNGLEKLKFLFAKKKEVCINESIRNIKTEAKNNYENSLFVKIQNIYRTKKANNNLQVLKNEKAKEIKINKVNKLTKNIENVMDKLNKKLLLKKFKDKNKAIILFNKKNVCSDIIKNLLKKNVSYKKCEKLKENRKILLEKVNNITIKINYFLTLKKKNLFLEKFNQIVNTNKFAFKIQNRIRILLAKNRMNNLIKRKNKEMQIANKNIQFLSEKINNYLIFKKKKSFFNKLYEIVKTNKLKISNSVKIQSIFRKNKARKILNDLKIQKKNLIKNITNFNYFLEKIKQRNHKKKFFSNFKDLLRDKNSKSIKIQSLFRKNISIKKFFKLKIEDTIKKQISGFLTLQNIFNKSFKKNNYPNIINYLQEKIIIINYNTNNMIDKLRKIISSKNFQIKSFLLNLIDKKSQYIIFLKNNQAKKIQRNYIKFKKEKLKELKKIKSFKENTQKLFLTTSKIYQIKIFDSKKLIFKLLKNKINLLNKIIKIQQIYKIYCFQKTVKIQLKKITTEKFLNFISNKIKTKIITNSKKKLLLHLSEYYLHFMQKYNKFLKNNQVNFKIKNIIDNFCHKILQIHIANKYWKKFIFKFMYREFNKNKHNIFLRKLSIRKLNIYNKQFKIDLFSSLRICAKYFVNKKKIKNPELNRYSNNENNKEPPRNSFIKKIPSLVFKENLKKSERFSVTNSYRPNLTKNTSQKNLLNSQKINQCTIITDQNLENYTNNNSKFFEKNNLDLDYSQIKISDQDLFLDSNEKPTKYNAANDLITKYCRGSNYINSGGRLTAIKSKGNLFNKQIKIDKEINKFNNSFDNQEEMSIVEGLKKDEKTTRNKISDIHKIPSLNKLLFLSKVDNNEKIVLVKNKGCQPRKTVGFCQHKKLNLEDNKIKIIPNKKIENKDSEIKLENKNIITTNKEKIENLNKKISKNNLLVEKNEIKISEKLTSRIESILNDINKLSMLNEASNDYFNDPDTYNNFNEHSCEKNEDGTKINKNCCGSGSFKRVCLSDYPKKKK